MNVQPNVISVTVLPDDFYKSIIEGMIAFNPEKRSDLWHVMEELLQRVQNLNQQENGLSGKKQVLLRKLGKGALGNVYEKSWKGIRVAVKRILKISRDANRSDQEIIKLNHPNVIKTLHVKFDGKFK